MFTILGGDGREYGPVTADQIRAWIAAGRANLETQAKAIGSAEWRRLADYAEFGAVGAPPAPAAEPPPPPAFAPATEPAPAPVPVGDVDPKMFADDLIARAKPLDIMGCIERGWNLLTANFWSLVGTTLAVFIVEMIVSKLCSFLPGPHYELFGKITLGPDVWIGSLFSTPLASGLYYYYLQKIRGRPTHLGEAFIGLTQFFVPLFLLGIVSGFLSGLGCLLLVLPGIYLVVAWSFARILVMDHHMSFWTAMEVSRRVVTAQWWRVLGLWLLAGFVGLLGLIGLLIGVLVTMPILFGAACCAYEDLFNPPR